MYKGYVFFKNGDHTEPVILDSPEDTINYCRLQMGIQYEVRIVDDDDFIVLHAVEGKIIFPV